MESATAWWRTCEFFSMARLREVSLLLIGFLGIVAICHLAAALREKYPSGSPRCHLSTNASKKKESSFNLVGFSTFFTTPTFFPGADENSRFLSSQKAVFSCDLS